MSQRSAGSAPQLYQEDGDEQSHSVESHRLVSEDHSHYILIKGEGGYDDMFTVFQYFTGKLSVVRVLKRHLKDNCSQLFYYTI